MAKVFVLQEVGWEYNDENYYRPETGGGKPLKVYHDKKAAAEAALELTANNGNFKGDYANPLEYCSYDNVNEDTINKFNDKLIEIFGAEVEKVSVDEHYSWNVPKKATLDQRKKLVALIEKLFGLVFYEVVSVEEVV